MKKKKLVYAVIGTLLCFSLMFLVANEKKKSVLATTEVEFENPALTNVAIKKQRYVEQLTKEEKKIYDQVVQCFEQYQGTVIELEEPISIRMFTRISEALLMDNYNYFYGFMDYALTKEDKIVDKSKQEFEDQEKRVIQKFFVYIDTSDFNEETPIIEKDHVINLKVCKTKLEVQYKNRVQEIKERKQKTSDMLELVLKDIPKEGGQLETLEYFMEWIEKNVQYDDENFEKVFLPYIADEELGNANDQEIAYNDYVKGYLYPSSTSSILEGKAMCVGFSKVLVFLCKSVGIDAYEVHGNNIAGNLSHSIVGVKIDKETAYIDLSGIWSYIEQKSKFRSEDEVRNILRPTIYFEKNM